VALKGPGGHFSPGGTIIGPKTAANEREELEQMKEREKKRIGREEEEIE
jgi:hypothetical protein